ncbi:hypothetical protein PO909_002868 [Leuciscus waleckii]
MDCIFITGLKMKSSVNTIWFLNLAAVADFLFSFFLIFNIIHEYREFDWPFGKCMCFLSSLVTLLNMFACFLLTAISLDRCLSAWVVVWSRTKRTVLKARIICLLIWLASVACSLPLVISQKTISLSAQQTLCIHDIQEPEPYYKRLVLYNASDTMYIMRDNSHPASASRRGPNHPVRGYFERTTGWMYYPLRMT